MATKESDVTQYLDSALNAFGDALKAGVKAQEEMVKWWTGAAEGGNPLGYWNKRTREFFDEGIPAAQKQVQECIKLVDLNYRRSAELLRKAVNADQNGALENVREKLRELWEQSISVFKENAEAMAQANVRLMETWSEMVRKQAEQTEAKVSAVAAAAAKAK